MATIFTGVKPGDVISSDLMNFILTKMEEIEGRVQTLESGGSSSTTVRIVNFLPPNQIAAGQELAVVGTNFAFPPEQNTVTIDGTPVTSFRPGSTTTVIRLIVPTTLTIPAGGRNVTVRVANTAGEHAALYRVMPAVVAPGNPPQIDSIQPASGFFNMVNQPILIAGQNFATDPSENLIRFRLVLAGAPEVVYPLPGTTLTINSANSSTTQIEVTVPDITQIPSGASRNVTVEVGVGAQVPAVQVIPIRRG